MKKIKILIIGGGNRGFAYAGYALANPERVEIAGVAEPREEYRNLFVKTHKIKKENVFSTWQEAAKKEKFADAVIIATQDRMHAEPAIAFAKKGYHMLLEKPMAETPEKCQKIYDAVKKAGIIFGVCHVLRYAPYTKKIKAILDSGVIGDIISIQRVEPVGYWHYAHSYVRGNWRNQNESSFMLLAKSCHDIDWIHYIIGQKCTSVSSFGGLKYFTAENKPPHAAARCLDCKVEKNCPYSAKKIYLGNLKAKKYDWPLNVITTQFTEKAVTEALRKGPYGRCVFSCDNDVVDNQIVNMQFEGGCTASFVMTAFTEMGGGRRTTIFGTKGEIRGNEEAFEVYDFLTNKVKKYNVMEGENDASSGHGGGDFGLMNHFVKAVSENDPSLILSGPEETLESHLLVFAAEQSRLKNKVVQL